MQYFKILNMNREPFSNSPEPEFFYKSAQYLGCLQQLELAIRLRRGLNVVMGNVGTGKTTLCRELLLRFVETEDDRNEFETHLLLDPAFSTAREFLSAVAVTCGETVGEGETDWQLKERIKNHLFHKGVDEKKTVVLIIDEGQKLPAFCREILREFLNYETNEHKLLQIIIFAQKEFQEILKEHVNFADRVNQYYFLEPMGFRETMAMIRFRLARAGRAAGSPLFTIPGLWEVYRATGGYPRRIITLCHQVLLALIIQNRIRAGFPLVRSVSRRMVPDSPPRGRWATAVLTAAVLLSLVFLLVFQFKPLDIIRQNPLFEKVAAVKNARSGESAAGQTPRDMETTPAAAENETATVKSPARAGDVPTSLGRVKMKEGVTVNRLLLAIYGKTGPARFPAIVRANPHIEDLNWVRTGEEIAFPAIPLPPEPWPRDGKRVMVASARSLAEAYELYKGYAGYVRLLPFWNPREGMVFALATRKVFAGENEARQAMRQLPAPLRAGAKIMAKPGDDTVFFAN